MPSGPRQTARPGAGPGRGRPRARPQLRRPSPTPPSDAAGAPEAPEQVAAPTRRRRPRASVTTRAIALTVVLLVLTISYASSLRIYFSQAHDIATTQAEIVDRQARIASLQTEVARWNDAEYVKTQARERLGWVVPGETGFRVVGPDGKPLGGGAVISSAMPTQEESKPAWWARLWGSVRAADQPAPEPTTTKPPPPITTKTRTIDSTPSPTAAPTSR